MPSKRKKNKRRMRRVQTQRMALEDQYGPSGMGTIGVCAVSAPVTTQVKVPKTSEPPIAVPVKTPVALVSPSKVPVEVPPVQPVLEEVPVTLTMKAMEDLKKDLLESRVEEQAVIKESEGVTVPVTEVTASTDEPLPIPDESETLEPLKTPADNKDEVKGVAEISADESVVGPEETASAAETLTAVQPARETAAGDVEPAVEVNEPAVEVVGGPVVEAEPMTVPLDIHTFAEITKDSQTTSDTEKAPAEAAGPAETVVEPGPQQHAATLEESVLLVESASSAVAEGFVVTESALAVEEKQISETTTEAPAVPSETLAESHPAHEPVLMSKEIVIGQDESVAQVETEAKKNFAVDNGLTLDTINKCLGEVEVATKS
nr:calphotin [Misgurnus anguillicaudatus]